LLSAFLIDKGTTTVLRVQITNPTDKTNSYYINNSSFDDSASILSIKDAFEISEIDGVLGSATTSLDKVYGFFRRPNPEARLTGMLGTNIYPDTDTRSFDRVEVTIRSKKNNVFMKKIVILATGQMYVSDW
jgi:hypothetical protein